MESNMLKIVELLDSSDKIEGKLNIVDICYDIMETIYYGSRKSDAKINALKIEKIVENIVKKLDGSEIESLDSEIFIKLLYEYLYSADIFVEADALLKIKIIEEHYVEKMECNPYVKIVESFEGVGLLEKSCLSTIYKQYLYFLTLGAYRLLGPSKGEEIISEFKSKSLGELINSLDEATFDDEIEIEDLVNELNSKLTKLSKDIYLNKYKEGELDLSKCLLSSLYNEKPKKDIIPIFISDIYERTNFIEEEDSDNEFTKDCCDLLNISKEEYKKQILLPGQLSQLQLTRVLRKINFNQDEE